MTVFFTGCTHFDHDNIIKLADRPFNTIVEMNEQLVHRWNSVVKHTDHVYHLGDVSWTGAEFWMKQLNGRINFILGNHDDNQELQYLAETNTKYTFHGVYHELKFNHQRFVLMHYPIEDWNKRYSGSIHLHAHTHSKELRNPSVPRVQDSGLTMAEDYDFTLPRRYPQDMKCNRFCVGMDSTSFAPISFEQIMEESRRD